MHTLSLKKVGCRGFINAETTSGSSEGEPSNISHSISLTYVEGDICPLITAILWAVDCNVLDKKLNTWV